MEQMLHGDYCNSGSYLVAVLFQGLFDWNSHNFRHLACTLVHFGNFAREVGVVNDWGGYIHGSLGYAAFHGSG